MPCATNSSTKTLPDPKGHAEGPSSSARLIWGCWCRLRRSFSNSVQLSNLPPYSAFLAFFCRAPRGGGRGCRRSLAERSLKCPSYTNFTDRRWGAGLLIQTNRITGRSAASTRRLLESLRLPTTSALSALPPASQILAFSRRQSSCVKLHNLRLSGAHSSRPEGPCAAPPPPAK